MTEAERIGRATRARAARDEFLAPLFSEIRAEYAERIMAVATTELTPATRADKITALSTALKVVEALENGIGAVLLDGEIVEKERLRSDRIEKLTAPQRRLLNIGGLR